MKTESYPILAGSAGPASYDPFGVTTVILNRSRFMDRVTESCPQCGAPADVSNLLPLSEIFCGQCQGVFVARRLFGRFQVEELLGRGGMGAVYKALDVVLGRRVALKILREDLGNDEEFVSRLAEEAEITASVNHPNVIRVFGQGACHGMYYIILELVQGGSLADLIAAQGPIPEETVLNLGIQIASALGAAAGKGLLHRDVKPGNILLGQGDVVKLVDFGLSSFQGEIPPRLNEVWGSAHYVAPEKLDGLEDIRSDIYSLGATLFHALAGRPVFTGANSDDIAQKHLENRAPNLQTFAPTVSKSIAYCIKRMLERDPVDRYQTYDELIEHLKFARDYVSPLQTHGVEGNNGWLSAPNAGLAVKHGLTFAPKRSVLYAVAAALAVGAIIAGGTFALPQKPEKIVIAPPVEATPSPVMMPLATPPLAPAVYEAENGLLFGGAKFNNDHFNYSGAGYIEGFEETGAAATFMVYIPVEGFYKVRLRYANSHNSRNAKETATISIYVNGEKVRQTNLPYMETWDEWGDVSEILPFISGWNTIAYQRDAADSGRVNLDFIEVSGAKR